MALHNRCWLRQEPDTTVPLGLFRNPPKSPALSPAHRESHLISYLLVLAGLMPIVLVAWYVAAYGRPIPIADQWWDTVYVAVKTKAGILEPEDLLVRSGGHRLAIIRVVAALSTILTDYDGGPLRFATFVTTLLNLELAILLLKKFGRLLPAFFFLFAVTLFTLNADSNSWLDMYYSQWQQALFFVLLGLIILQQMRPGWLAFVLVVLCAMAASLSMGAGIAAWISLPVAALGIPAYRRGHYAVLWLAALTSFAIFYYSDYAVHRYKNDTPSLSWMLNDGFLAASIFPIRFQAIRFLWLSSPVSPIVVIVATLFTLACFFVLGANFWQLICSKEKKDEATAAMWGSLALFSVGIAVIVLLGRSSNYAARYSPGADGFWLAFTALALLVLRKQPPAPLAILNMFLLATMVSFTVLVDSQAFRLAGGDGSARCDQTIRDFPLYRDESFRKCFKWSNDQSVYHLAALRLSVFRDEKSELILPRAGAPVITDLPNRWLSVYVRDYMMAGVPSDKLYSIAPVSGKWRPMELPSPFYRGEWSTDILAQPLAHVWSSPAALKPDLAILLTNQPLVWYLTTPETDAHMAEIDPALSKLGYVRSTFEITSTRYRFARFSLWCFEQRGSDACRSSQGRN